MNDTIINNKAVDCYHAIDYLGINKGDTIFVSSDIRPLYVSEKHGSGKFPNIHKLIDSFIQKVGPTGTLLFPTYNWGFCKGELFDIKNTRCLTGSLGQYALQRPDFKRTRHPIYSFAVWGKDQDYLCSLNNKSSFGPDSPFAYLSKAHAKNIVIGLPLCNCFTFVHHIEEISGYPKYRYIKDFTSQYKDENGEISIRAYSMFVRDLDMDVINDSAPLEKELIQHNIAKKIFINKVTYTVVDLHSAVEPIMNDISYNRSRKICTYKGQEDE